MPTPSVWVYGCDSSFDELTPAQAQAFKDSGGQVYAQCLWTGAEQPATRIPSLRAAQSVGLKIVGYISAAPGHDGAWHIDHGRAGVPDDLWGALDKTPLDIELTGLNFNTHVVPGLNRLVALGKTKDVYTSYNAWVNYLGNPQRPVGTGLWNAVWDQNPDFDFPTLRFGGWGDEEVWGEQWDGGTNVVVGQFADRDQFRSSAFHIGDPVPDPHTDVPVPPPTDAQWLSAVQQATLLVYHFANRQRPPRDLKQIIDYLMQ
jgi:hypothetical protein